MTHYFVYSGRKSGKYEIQRYKHGSTPEEMRAKYKWSIVEKGLNLTEARELRTAKNLERIFASS